MGVRQLLVCEDERLIADRLCRFIGEVVDYRVEIHVVTSLNQAFEFLSNRSIDLLFLDLNLHGKDGFELLKRLSCEAFHTVIVSAYTEKALEAFEYGVLDFVGKPFTKERLRKAMDRFSKDTLAKGPGLKYVAIKGRSGVNFVPIEKIDYIKAAGIYSELLLLDGTTKIYDKPMNQLLKLLPEGFERVHKSYVVRLDLVVGIFKRKANTYDLELRSGNRIPVSRSMRKTIVEKLARA